MYVVNRLNEVTKDQIIKRLDSNCLDIGRYRIIEFSDEIFDEDFYHVSRLTLDLSCFILEISAINNCLVRVGAEKRINVKPFYNAMGLLNDVNAHNKITHHDKIEYFENIVESRKIVDEFSVITRMAKYFSYEIDMFMLGVSPKDFEWVDYLKLEDFYAKLFYELLDGEINIEDFLKQAIDIKNIAEPSQNN